MTSMYLYLLAPGTPPYNLTSLVVNSTAVYLTWFPPKVQNGVIVSYELDYHLSSQLVTVYVTNTLDYLVSNLQEDTSYTFTISAFTRIGGGPKTSVSAKTDIAGIDYSTL